MSRLLHHGVLLLLLGAIAPPGARAAATDDVQTNRSVSIPARPEAADANPEAGAEGESNAAPTASSPSPAPASNPDASTSTPPDPSASPTPSQSQNESTLPARERLPLGPTDATEGDREQLAEDSSDQSWVLKTLAALGVVIGLILLLRAALQRLGGTPAGPAGRGLIEVLARTSIAPRTQVLFLRINQRVIVVAQSSSGFQPLTELTDPDDVAWLLGRVESSKPMSITQGFRHLMQRAEQDYNDPENAGTDDGRDEQEQYVDRTRSQVSGLLSHIRTLKQRAP